MKKRRSDDSLVFVDSGEGGIDTAQSAAHRRYHDADARVPLHTIDHCQNHVLKRSKTRWHYMHLNYAAEA